MMTFDIVIAFHSCDAWFLFIVFIVYLFHCICRGFFYWLYLYSYMQLLAASMCIKFSVSVSVTRQRQSVQYESIALYMLQW